jgi:hypothetical protein
LHLFYFPIHALNDFIQREYVIINHDPEILMQEDADVLLIVDENMDCAFGD